MVTNPLTQRESEVLQLAIRGLSNDEIAASLAISRRTVETHMRMVFQKTGAVRRTQLAGLSPPVEGLDTAAVNNVAAPPQWQDAGVDAQRRRLEFYGAAPRVIKHSHAASPLGLRDKLFRFLRRNFFDYFGRR